MVDYLLPLFPMYALRLRKMRYTFGNNCFTVKRLSLTVKYVAKPFQRHSGLNMDKRPN